MRVSRCSALTVCLLAASHVSPLFAEEHLAAQPPVKEVRPEPVYFSSQMLYQIERDLRVIDGAKDLWGIELNKPLKDEPTWEDIKRYLKNGIPQPPCGGKYVLNNLETAPEIRISLHDLQAYKRKEWQAEKERLLQNKANTQDSAASGE